MDSFAVFCEDFNNWRSPSIGQGGPNIINIGNAGPQPTGFKGAQGLTWQGGQETAQVRIPSHDMFDYLKRVNKEARKSSHYNEGHCKVVGCCGHSISNCRCSKPHPIVKITLPCFKCLKKP